MGDDFVLRVEGLDVSYGESKVLFDISLDVRANEVVSCVGRNGAGKTTLLKTIGGFLRPSKGTVTFQGKRILGLRTYVIAKMGLRYIAQDKKVFSDLTVRENLELASYATGDSEWDKVLNYFPKLKGLLDNKGAYLSGGERQMLMIAMAFLGQPVVLLIDEPTEGLAPSIIQNLTAIFRQISRNMALVIVEQNLSVISEIASRVYGIREGRISGVVSNQEDIKQIKFEAYL